MTQNPKDPLFLQFEAALSRAALSDDSSRVQALRETLQELEMDAAGPEQLAQYRAVLDLLQSQDMAQAPDTWIDTAMATIRQLDGAATEKSGWVERTKDAIAAGSGALEDVWATLVLDSYAGAALPGIRGNATMQPRQLMYESPYGTIHLQIESQPDGHSDVFGQFLPTDGLIETGTEVSLLSGETSRPNEMGEFRFAGVDPGDLYLRLAHGDILIQLEPIHLTSQEE